MENPKQASALSPVALSNDDTVPRIPLDVQQKQEEIFTMDTCNV